VPPGFVPLPPPGRTGVTFGYWNWWIIVLLNDALPEVAPVQFVTGSTQPSAGE
jgi:hypothetical protein